ncbi:Calmodulin-like protein 4 [Dufourea novaeangliae]|uniref:Calmodulin-like protein 4 n=1 Tax=Dufourea novaeangliae TaxID=178035 RepID=A0A154P232_DUFNO|nr:Calmodulin-like protein 4 [Dufourea novaeangliae]
MLSVPPLLPDLSAQRKLCTYSRRVYRDPLRALRRQSNRFRRRAVYYRDRLEFQVRPLAQNLHARHLDDIRASFAIQNRVDGSQAARAETIIVTLVTAGRAGEHNEVSVLTAGRALFRIVLEQIMTDLVGQSDVRNGRRYVLPVIQQSHYPGVQRLHAAAIVLEKFRECFYLFARSGQIRTLDELTIIMRSLGLSPTIAELNKYLKDKGGKMSFADFLEVMHLQTRSEDLPKEVIQAFQAADKSRSGTIPARQLAHMLLHWGEQLSNKEVEQIFREANVSPSGYVKYEDFVKIACAPVPDYY